MINQCARMSPDAAESSFEKLADRRDAGGDEEDRELPPLREMRRQMPL